MYNNELRFPNHNITWLWQLKKKKKKTSHELFYLLNWWNISYEQFDMHYQGGRSTKRS